MSVMRMSNVVTSRRKLKHVGTHASTKILRDSKMRETKESYL